MSTCRFCKSWNDADQMIQYGTRHYAHFKCYLDADKRLEDLHDWQIAGFPYRLLKDRGLLPVGEAALAREQSRIAKIDDGEART